jgi:AraC-like DNA-binding protein
MDEHVRQVPAARLRPYISWYAGYRQRGVPPAVHRGLPSPALTLIFTLDEPLTMAAHPDPGQAPDSFTTLIGGLHTSPALIVHAGAQSGVQLALRPAGARALLGLPAGELANIDVPADAVLGPVAKRIHQRLGTAGTWPERFSVLDHELTRLIGGTGRPSEAGLPPEVDFAWRLLLRSGGTVPVSELAERTGWSTRHLANRFRAEIGLTPKAAARVVRFGRARQRLVTAGPGNLADLAASCGYFDQAHLAREFRALAGCPPTQWLAEEFANIQAGAWPIGE